MQWVVMPVTTPSNRDKLPGRFEALVAVMPPQAIMDEVQYKDTVEMIDRLMAVPRFTRGQSSYLETLVQLVEAYEAATTRLTSPASGSTRSSTCWPRST